jgi:hypothetical protein
MLDSLRDPQIEPLDQVKRLLEASLVGVVQLIGLLVVALEQSAQL